MVIGGKSGSDIIDSVELYNWETGANVIKLFTAISYAFS
jgi:hypothetical protein